MAIFIDENGNEVDLPISKAEDIKALQDKSAKVDDLEGRIKMYEGKEMSIKHIKDMSEEEKKQLTAAQLQERARSEKLEEELTQVKDTMKNSWIKNKLRDLGVSDEDTKKKILKMASAISDDPELGTNSQTEEGLSKKLELAYHASGANTSTAPVTRQIDPIFGANAAQSGFALPPRKDGWEESDEFKSLSNKLLGK